MGPLLKINAILLMLQATAILVASSIPKKSSASYSASLSLELLVTLFGVLLHLNTLLPKQVSITRCINTWRGMRIRSCSWPTCGFEIVPVSGTAPLLRYFHISCLISMIVNGVCLAIQVAGEALAWLTVSECFIYVLTYWIRSKTEMFDQHGNRLGGNETGGTVRLLGDEHSSTKGSKASRLLNTV